MSRRHVDRLARYKINQLGEGWDGKVLATRKLIVANKYVDAGTPEMMAEELILITFIGIHGCRLVSRCWLFNVAAMDIV